MTITPANRITFDSSYSPVHDTTKFAISRAGLPLWIKDASRYFTHRNSLSLQENHIVDHPDIPDAKLVRAYENKVLLKGQAQKAVAGFFLNAGFYLTLATVAAVVAKVFFGVAIVGALATPIGAGIAGLFLILGLAMTMYLRRSKRFTRPDRVNEASASAAAPKKESNPISLPRESRTENARKIAWAPTANPPLSAPPASHGRVCNISSPAVAPNSAATPLSSNTILGFMREMPPVLPERTVLPAFDPVIVDSLTDE